ncbi:MAG: sugar nucleotide-binding protein [Saprospiraceae bacterium]
MAQCCASVGCHFIHFSSDYVYDRGLNRPITETDAVAGVGVYAASKLAGDVAVLRVLPTATIIRTSWVYSSEGHNFVKTMLRLGMERPELRVVFDQVGTPTYARDLADAVIMMLERIHSGQVPLSDAAGVFHYSNEGVCSWYDFARSIFKMTGLNCQLLPIESEEYPTPAQRPAYSVLNKKRFKAVFQLPIRHWEDALYDCLEVLLADAQ